MKSSESTYPETRVIPKPYPEETDGYRVVVDEVFSYLVCVSLEELRELDSSGWKLHLSLAEQGGNVQKAWVLIKPILKKNGIKVAKVLLENKYLPEFQWGKEVTIYFQPDGINWQRMLEAITQILVEKNIEPNYLAINDRSISGSSFFGCRNERDKTGKYIQGLFANSYNESGKEEPPEFRELVMRNDRQPKAKIYKKEIERNILHFYRELSGISGNIKRNLDIGFLGLHEKLENLFREASGKRFNFNELEPCFKGCVVDIKKLVGAILLCQGASQDRGVFFANYLFCGEVSELEEDQIEITRKVRELINVAEELSRFCNDFLSMDYDVFDIASLSCIAAFDNDQQSSDSPEASRTRDIGFFPTELSVTPSEKTENFSMRYGTALREILTAFMKIKIGEGLCVGKMTSEEIEEKLEEYRKTALKYGNDISHMQKWLIMQILQESINVLKMLPTVWAVDYDSGGALPGRGPESHGF